MRIIGQHGKLFRVYDGDAIVASGDSPWEVIGGLDPSHRVLVFGDRWMTAAEFARFVDQRTCWGMPTPRGH